ncbi:O-succinylhomoserine sulfhydrylase [Kineococcus indalonis]|uniref:O-succinylhomoserine sulfhydrylase n=1 Tax=Kineococcus indalonis TaxID=2696566 RepID=UPI002B1BD975|nr:O-succinylhomoserine sulfhydrylase [Kineococcus indalonis]NAZ87666.1 O-succinylhomoserine sulfhydrylase [Kineococcus indalonis]
MSGDRAPRPWRPDTTAVRGGLARSDFQETSEAMYLTSGYVYGSAADAEAAFTGEVDRYVYSRYGNPTVSVFTERMRLLEGAEACYGLASGMSAVFYALAALLGAGDRVVAARSLFGSCYVVLDEILPRWGVTTEFVDGEDLSQWERALATPAQAVFFETPANPMQTLVDIEAVAQLAHAAGAAVVVDNAFASPVGQRPLEFGADVVVYSATKHVDGQGRVMGGAVLGTTEFIDGRFRELTRHTGPTLSPFNAWTLAKGLETLGLRVRHSAATALRIAEHLEDARGVRRVRYPTLPSHPQAELAKRQMELGGTVVTFELDAPAGRGKERAFEVLDRLGVVDISNNLGDAKSLATHPATTTHRRLGEQGRAAIGLSDAVLRLSVGLEDPDDLLDDLDRALRR